MENIEYSKLTVVIPAKNEAKTITTIVERVKQSLPGAFIIVVDNGSSDGTLDVIKKLKVYPAEESLPGKGRAMQKGLGIVHTEFVLFHDADLEYFPEDCVCLYKKLLNNPDTVWVGNRKFANKSRSYWANKLMQTVLAIRLGSRKPFELDILSGTRAGKTTKIKALNLQAADFRIETEFTKKVIQNNINIEGTPIQYAPRSYAQGKKIKPSDIWGLLKVAIF